MSAPRLPSQKPKSRVIFLGILFLAVAGNSGAADQTGTDLLDPGTSAAIGRLFENYAKPGTPGCALGILRDGRAVYIRAFGLANLEHEIPATPGTVFEAGSVSKQYAVGAVQILAGEGQLSLDNDIRKYLPEVPDFGHVITIRHLMTHTSGLRDQWGLLNAAGRAAGTVVHTLDEILDLVNRQKRLNFPPGEDYLYSNTNFSLLSWIVLRVSGKSMADFSQERIFKPLGMARTQWRDDYRDIVKGRATAYSPAGEDRYRQNMPFTNVYGNGGLLTTVGDMLIWAENFWEPRVIGRERLDEMEIQGKLNDGTALSYALGLRVSEYRGLRQVTHGGSTAGYRAYLVRYPSEHVAIAVLSNNSRTDPEDLAHKVTDILLARKLTEPPEVWPIEVAPEDLRKMAGLYRDLKTDAILILGFRNGKLVVASGGGRELIPVAPGRFLTTDGTEYVFEDRKGEAPPTVRRTPAGEPPDIFTRSVVVHPSARELTQYAGRYWSEELEVAYVVSFKEGQLTIRHRPFPAVPLLPTYADGFAPGGRSGGLLIRFTRDESGNIDGLSAYSGRVRHLRFSKT